MHLTRTVLDEAARRGLINVDQVDALWAFVSEQSADTPSFRFTHILYYFGGLIAIGAMTLFMTLGWETFGGWGVFMIALAYAGGGLALTEYLLHRQRLPIPAGITAAFVVALTPLAIYGLQQGLGWWADDGPYRDYHRLIGWRWLLMELGTLAVGAVLLWRYRLPFMVMPVAVTLLYMSMDLVPLLALEGYDDWARASIVSLWFGLAMIALALWVDLRTRSERDFAYWLYLFGVLTFWGGLSMQHSGDPFNKFLYFCINLLMIGAGAVLSRRVFVVFGGLGAAGYLGYLAYDVFKDSALFPVVLTVMGLGLIYLGVVWQRHEQALAVRLRSRLPAAVQAVVERRR